MQYFNFARLINKYKSEFVLITRSEGHYEYGEWVKGEEAKTTMQGAIISHKESKIFRAEGTLTANDRRLFMLQPIDRALKGAKVIYNDNVYSVEDETTNGGFTGVWAYVLRFVSSFNETE